MPHSFSEEGPNSKSPCVSTYHGVIQKPGKSKMTTTSAGVVTEQSKGKWRGAGDLIWKQETGVALQAQIRREERDIHRRNQAAICLTFPKNCVLVVVIEFPR